MLYRAGRTAAGAQATASHTASIAGDYKVTRALAGAAGDVVAESLAVSRTWCGSSAACAARRSPAGDWVGAVSNAGFECVAIADHLGRFELPAFAAATRRRLGSFLEESRLGSIVEDRNPFDVTPILADPPSKRRSAGCWATSGSTSGWSAACR